MRRRGLSSYAELIRTAAEDPAEFTRAAFDDLDLPWLHPYSAYADLSDGPEWATWLTGGRTNVAWLAVQRWADTDRTAIVWEADDGVPADSATRSCTTDPAGGARPERARGARRRRDRYVPTALTEAVVVLLAAARIGAIAAPAFSGYGAAALAERLELAGAKVLVTADRFLRRGRVVSTVGTALDAAASVSTVTCVVGVDRLGVPSPPSRVPVLAPGGPAEPSRREQGPGVVGRDALPVRVHVGIQGSTQRRDPHPRGHAVPDRHRIEVELRTERWRAAVVDYRNGLGHGADLHGRAGSPSARPPCCSAVSPSIRVPVGCGTWLSGSTSPTSPVPDLVRLLASKDEPWVSDHELTSLRVLGSTGEPWTSPAWRWLHHNVAGGVAPTITGRAGQRSAAGSWWEARSCRSPKGASPGRRRACPSTSSTE